MGAYKLKTHQGKKYIITGANRGIGWATAQVLASQGADLILTARTPSVEWESECTVLSGRTGCEIASTSLDLDSAESIKDFVAFVKQSGKIDGLVNNAGVTYNALFQMSQLSRTREIFETNFFGLFELTQSIVRLLARGRSGSIVNISSSAAFEGNRGRSVYGATKAAVITLTKSMARELAPLGIRVNAVAPGMTATDMVSESMSEDVIEMVASSTALKRMGKPSEIAEAVSFLLSEKSSYISGIVLRVDGGLSST
jgi:3-oxoacyl-[acyl-carrier protein] reductase